MGKLMAKIRQNPCSHRYADSRLEAKHDEEDYTFTSVCVKRGKKFVVKIPRNYIDVWETEDKP